MANFIKKKNDLRGSKSKKFMLLSCNCVCRCVCTACNAQSGCSNNSNATHLQEDKEVGR